MSAHQPFPTKPCDSLHETIPGLTAAAAAAVFGTSTAVMATPSRRAVIARARQFAVYLHYVGLGESVSACARLFARDRSTVRHACARIEDLRDDPCFDFGVTILESALRAQRDLARLLVAATETRGDVQ